MQARSVYKVTYDIKVGGQWLAVGSSGWSFVNVVTRGDARDAAERGAEIARTRRVDTKGTRPSKVKIIGVALVVGDIVT